MDADWISFWSWSSGWPDLPDVIWWGGWGVLYFVVSVLVGRKTYRRRLAHTSVSEAEVDAIMAAAFWPVLFGLITGAIAIVGPMYAVYWLITAGIHPPTINNRDKKSSS